MGGLRLTTSTSVKRRCQGQDGLNGHIEAGCVDERLREDPLILQPRQFDHSSPGFSPLLAYPAPHLVHGARRYSE